MRMQKLFAMKGQCRGAARAVSEGRGSRLTVEIYPAVRDARIYASSVSGALNSGKLTAATGASLGDIPPEDIGAVFVTEGGRIVASGANGVTACQFEAAALKVRLALAKETDKAAPQAGTAAREVVAHTAHVSENKPRAVPVLQEAGKAVPLEQTAGQAKRNAVEPVPQSRAGAAIVSRANSLFSPEESDYDTAAFLAREPFRPRPVAGTPVPPADGKPCARPAADNRPARRRGGRRRYRR